MDGRAYIGTVAGRPGSAPRSDYGRSCVQTGPALPHVGQFQYTQYTRISPGGPWTGIENVIAAIFKHGSL
ncbi:hypothetical protein J6590_103660 [Homalodisca vitripennis]|nr:hypothetical protein J6590_103660 [Homalodisca vitripennis]